MEEKIDREETILPNRLLFPSEQTRGISKLDSTLTNLLATSMNSAGNYL